MITTTIIHAEPESMMIQRVIIIIIKRRVVIHFTIMAMIGQTAPARIDQINLGIGSSVLVHIKHIATLVDRPAPVLGEVLQVVAVHRGHHVAPGVAIARVARR